MNTYKKLLYWGSIVFLMLLSLLSYGQDPNFHIYLCFGQSNMEGQGTIENQDRTVDSRFQVLQAVNCNGAPQEVWRNATPPLCRCFNGLGPSDYFGRTMVENLPDNITVGVINVSVGGCDIGLFDKYNYADYYTADYITTAAMEYGGSPYARLVELAQIAQQDGVIKGILLHQGETNTGQTDWPNKVKDVYDNLCADLGLNATETPLLVGEVVHADQGGICASHNNIIANVPNVIPNSYVISSSGCTDQSDNLHFDAAGYRELGRRYAEQMLQLIDVEEGPDVTILSPATDTVIAAGNSITIQAIATPVSGNVQSVALVSDGVTIEQQTSAPYEFTWNNISAGEHTVSIVATDVDGLTGSATITINARISQSAYGGEAHAIPGTIEFEEFDLGGQDSAYYDATVGNDAGVDYRADEDVDIEECTDDNGGYNIGYFTVGEWVEYTINAAGSGTYDIDLRVACNGDGRTISIEIDGNIIENFLEIPNTGGWQTWETISLEDVNIPSGTHILRVTVVGTQDYINLNYMTFTASGTITPPTEGVALEAGWNLIGYPFAESSNVEDALASIIDFVEIIKDNDGYFTPDTAPVLNSLSELLWGKGYMIKVSVDCTIDW